MIVYVPIAEDVQASDIVADIQRTRLTLGVKGKEPVLDGELWKEIKAHESFWVVDEEDGQRYLIVTLIKRDIWIDYDYLLEKHEMEDTLITERCYLDISIDGESAGRIVVGLYGNTVPNTVQNFHALCTGEKGNGTSGKPLHYKGTTFCRIIPGYTCQAGDTTVGDGTGGESIFGPTFVDESFSVKHSRPGLISMANSGPNTNGSQFFITLNEAPDLDDRHVVFGEVIEGFDVVQAVGECGDPKLSSEARGKVVIEDCGVLA